MLAAAPSEPSPACGRGQGEGSSPANSLHLEDAAAPLPPLHSACIEPSPATIAGRRRVAEQALRQWMRTMPR